MRKLIHKLSGLRPLHITALLWAMLGVAGCASAVPSTVDAQTVATGASALPSSEADRTAEAAILSKINATIGDAACHSDAQCRIIGLGVNACGGPAAWRPWSTQTTGNGESLETLALRLSELQRSRQTQDGMVSTCRYIPDPGASCQAQRCVLNSTHNPAS